MTLSDPAALAALTTPVLLAPRVLDGALADRLLERGAARAGGGERIGGEAAMAPPARRMAAGRAATGGPSPMPAGTAARPAPPPQGAGAGGAAADGLSEGERAMLDALKARDREVRAHEEAHARVGGRHAGEPAYTYQQGPDGGRYAVGGSVAIDVAPVEGDPEATIAKMAIVRAAALAPADPSASDRRIAAIAEAETRLAIAELARRETRAPAGDDADAGPRASQVGHAGASAEARAFDATAGRFLETLRALLVAVDPGRALDRIA